MKRIDLKRMAALGALALLAACSSDDGGSAPAPTATTTATVARTATATVAIPATIPATSTSTPLTSAPTATATVTPPAVTPGTQTPSTAAAFSALVVVRGDVPSSAGDALGAPPPEWRDTMGGGSFDRALSHARWRIVGPEERVGETDGDGTIALADLASGSYQLELSKSVDGNLIGITVPFHVGGGGRADLVIEIAQGLVRTTNSYTDGGSAVREVTAPNGSRVVTREGAVRELSGSGRTYVDADGDGTFEPSDCNQAPAVWLCNPGRECGPDRICSCAASCPLCEDCRVSVCAPPSQVPPYACGDGQACANAGDKCVCVSSCPECDDCAASVCVPACGPAQIAAVDVIGPSRLYVGQSGGMSATARLTDGWAIDVTQLVDWSSSDASVLSVDPWGSLAAIAVGEAEVTASLGQLESNAWPIEVQDRPALRHIYVQNLDCAVIYGVPEIGPDGTTPKPLPPGAIRPPDCRQVVRIGATVRFFALGEFEDGYYENITSKVTWELTPAGVGAVDGEGVFTALQVGTAQLSAHFGEIRSDASEIRVVDQPTIVALQIYPLAALPRPAGPRPPQDPAAGDAAIPCYDCGYVLSILKGDSLRFQATAAYDIGEWEDVTSRVSWVSTDPIAAPISATGELLAAAAGETLVSATLGDVSSNNVTVRVVESATLLGLSIYQESIDRVVAKGDEVFFRALGYYDLGFDRDVTEGATWRTSDETVGSFARPGVFVGHGAGTVEVWAESGGVQSGHLSIEVFQTSTLDYCDTANINRAEWSDAFNRVVLDSDCASYTPPDVASLRFTVTERERPNGVFDPCLDLYVVQGDRRVRTIREEGCGEPFLPASAPDFDEAKLRYQSLAFWDLKDDNGAQVPAGAYTVIGRFYLYYDPVVELPVVVGGSN